jgi:aquaporin Z
MQDRDWLKLAIVEFIGPFALVFAGVGAIIQTQGQDIVAIALAHGLAIGLMISATGHITGGAFNPAVTLGLFVAPASTPSAPSSTSAPNSSAASPAPAP